MKAKTPVAVLCLVLLSLTPACCTHSQKQQGLSGKESRMSDELLRSQVLRYKAEAEKEMAAVSQFISESQLASKINSSADSPFTPELAAEIATALADVHAETMIAPWDSDNVLRYNLFYERLKQRGADLTGLELEIPAEHDQWFWYHELLSPPIKEPPFQTPAADQKDTV